MPLEWNVLFIYITAFLFLGYPNDEGYGLGDMDPVLLALTVAGLLFFPVLGNLRPDLVSFLPVDAPVRGQLGDRRCGRSRPGAEAKLDEHIVKPAPRCRRTSSPRSTAPRRPRSCMQQTLGWRSLHSQGRGLNSVMINQLGDDIDTYTLREAEFACNAIIGFNFGDGHLHNDTLIEAIQKRCHFAPGEFIVVWVESEPVGNGRQQYWVMDAAVGIVERGSWAVEGRRRRAAVAAQRPDRHRRWTTAWPATSA